MKTFNLQNNKLVIEKSSFSSVYDYFQLMKPRVMSLVIFTAFVGMFLAPNNIHPILSIISLIAIGLGAGGSSAINMWYDADIDVLMKRTKKRPIPSNRIDPAEALTFGLIISLMSVLLLSFAANFFAGFLLGFTIFFYSVIYTIILKRRTSQNIVIGGASGALPPVVGWVSLTGYISIEPVILFMIIFFWTPPHFWALAIISKSDYKLANIPMLPISSGNRETYFQILLHTIILVIITLAPYLIGMSSFVYLLVSVIFGIMLIIYMLRMCYLKKDEHALSAFKFSILYLFVIFSALIIDRYFTVNLI